MATEHIHRVDRTRRADVFVAGDLEVAKQLCREYVMCGLCVTVEPCAYIYTGGEEAGVRVGLINYPRFPSTSEQLFAHALAIGELLMNGLHQLSYTVVADDETHWFSRHGEGLKY